MKVARHVRSNPRDPSDEVALLRARLAEAEQALLAIQSGEMDSVVVRGSHGPQIFTLEGAGHSYRMLIESMNEGALTLGDDGVILYANDRFAEMVKTPLEQVLGTSVLRFLSASDQAKIVGALERPASSGTTMQVLLQVEGGGGGGLPAHVSLRPVHADAVEGGKTGVVVTDVSDLRRAEEVLRAFARFMVQAQDVERERVADQLHENIAQRLSGILLHWKMLSDRLPVDEAGLRTEMSAFTTQLSDVAREVQLVSADLQAHGLAVTGLIPALRGAIDEFVEEAGIPVKLDCHEMPAALVAGADVALYRILQAALENVAKHADARKVEVSLSPRDGGVELIIRDDGAGFDPDERASTAADLSGFGLLGIRERAGALGGTVDVRSAQGAGTEIRVWMPGAPE
ncbi:MAG: sensor histidine kinase [Planctomycetota bacterium]